MVSKIGRCTAQPVVDSKNPLARLKSGLIHRLFTAHRMEQGKKFRINTDCNSCGICAKVCPAANISLNGNGKPCWSDHCEYCLAVSIYAPKCRQFRGIDKPEIQIPPSGCTAERSCNTLNFRAKKELYFQPLFYGMVCRGLSARRNGTLDHQAVSPKPVAPGRPAKGSVMIRLQPA
jgi:ferredoxin